MKEKPKPKPKPADSINVSITPDGVEIKHQDGRTHIEPIASLKRWALKKFREAFPYY